MKRAILLLVILLAAGVALAACASEDDTIVITDRFFANQMLDLVMNHQQYLDRPVQMEGLFRHMPPTADGQSRYMVMRYVADCCEVSAVGLQVLLGDTAPFDEQAWVEVTGNLIIHNGALALIVTSITELDEVGLWHIM